MDKSSKVFLDSFALGIACGFQKCLEVLTHTKVDISDKSPHEVPGELQNFLKLSAEVLNYFGEKLENEPNIEAFPFRSILEIVATSSEKLLPAAGIARQMSVVFDELVQAFKELIWHRSEGKLQPSEASTNGTPSEKTSSESDLSKELCQVLQEMGDILTKIVDGVQGEKSTVHSSQRFGVSGHLPEKTDLTADNISSATGEESMIETLIDDAKDCTGAIITDRADNTDGTVNGNDDVEEHKKEEEVVDTVNDCEESGSEVDQEQFERKIVGLLLEEDTTEENTFIKESEGEDNEDEVLTAVGKENCVLTEDEEVIPEVSEEKELLELSAIRVFREHLDRDGLYMEVFRTPRDRPTKHPSYTCRLLEMEAAAYGRSKRAAKRNALCKMIHLVVRKHEEGCLPKEISPFTSEELWALEDVCLGGDDYLSQLRQLCDSQNAPPPVFDVQLSKNSHKDKTFTVTCSALGRTAISTCSRKRSAKRHAARDIVKQYEQEAALAAAAAAAATEAVETSA